MSGGSTNPASPATTSAIARVALLTLILATHAVVADESPLVQQASGRPAVKPEPLDLSIGHISRYMDPAVLATPVPDVVEEIVVRGQRPEPLPEHRVVPQALGAIVYGVMNPLQVWRILVPDPNYEVPDKTEDDVREPPGAFRARISEPGAVYD
jgi:hypothetical protein